MRPDVLVAGQGIAGTLLGWELEQAGIAFAIADAGHARSASHVAAGMINPITGRRLVKGVRFDEWLPIARHRYQAIEAAWGISLWREMRIRRLFANERERAVFRQKSVSGELAPFLGPVDETGFWIEGAAQVDVRALLAAARNRWRDRLREAPVDIAAETAGYALVVDCTGVRAAMDPSFDFVPWRFSKGEILEIAIEGLPTDVVLNCGHWVLPMAPGKAWVGATHEPGKTDREPTRAGREVLEASARSLLGAQPFAVRHHQAGVRVNLPDKLPVAGRHPRHSRLGLLNGLGAKGVLWAPMLARGWVRHLTGGMDVDPILDLSRFAG